MKVGMSTHKIKGEDYYQCRDVKAERDKLLEEVAELLDRLEAAEKGHDELHTAVCREGDRADAYQVEMFVLRARIEAREKQEPVMWVNSSNINSSRINKERGGR